MRKKFSMCPELVAMMPSRKELDQRLADSLKPKEPEKESLGNVKRRLGDMYPYEVPKSKLKYTSYADVVNNKPFKGAYPESFSKVSNYFLDSGISPYYEVVEDLDYSPGVLTISTMIELTCSGKKWSLMREKDIEHVIVITEQYQKSLLDTLTDSNDPDMVRRKHYASKVAKFLNVMYEARARYELRTGKRSVTVGLQDLLAELF